MFVTERFFGTVSVQLFFSNFYIWFIVFLTCKRLLYILDTDSVLDIYFAKSFSCSMAGFFIFLTVPFKEKKKNNMHYFLIEDSSDYTVDP